MRQGAFYENGACRFALWAPKAQRMQVKLLEANERIIDMEKREKGWWQVTVPLSPGTDYFYLIDGQVQRPDPASALQAQDVHGPSRIVDHRAFPWTDQSYEPLPLSDYIFYELHIGTFTPEGTFEAAARKLPYLKDLGITAVEVMPVAQFPGRRNWGYDGAYLYAVQNSYGGPDGLRRLVDAAHGQGLAVVLDVVYNHLGPEGNYIRDFGPYFTNRYATPWGDALNFDQEDSDEVRSLFFENALYWFEEYHIDTLRLDALHSIFDQSAVHFIEELALRVEAFSKERGRKYYLVGESDLNDIRLVRSHSKGGYNLDAQWMDDFHHSVHACLTSEEMGYYKDFGRPEHLARSLREGYVYSGQYSHFRRRKHGNESRFEPADKFVVCIQNHDQTGNRMEGERLSRLVDLESLKLGAGTLLLAPYLPLLFMGEEYGEDNPFLYFISFHDRDLVEAVRKGRREEFSHFQWQQDFPDPADEQTFLRSKLDWQKVHSGYHARLLAFYRELIGLRKSRSDYASREGMTIHLEERQNLVWWTREFADVNWLCIMNYDGHPQTLKNRKISGRRRKRLDSSEPRWDGPGGGPPADLEGPLELTLPGRSIVLYEQAGTD